MPTVFTHLCVYWRVKHGVKYPSFWSIKTFIRFQWNYLVSVRVHDKHTLCLKNVVVNAMKLLYPPFKGISPCSFIFQKKISFNIKGFSLKNVISAGSHNSNTYRQYLSLLFTSRGSMWLKINWDLWHGQASVEDGHAHHLQGNKIIRDAVAMLSDIQMRLTNILLNSANTHGGYEKPSLVKLVRKFGRTDLWGWEKGQ